MRKKITKTLAVFFLMAAVLSGCGNKADEDTTISTMEFDEIVTDTVSSEEDVQEESTQQEEESLVAEETQQEEESQVAEATDTDTTIQDEDTPLADTPQQNQGAGGQTATPAHTHSYVETVTVQPSCNALGVKGYLCSCGDTYTEAIAAIPHTESDWTVTAKATTSAKGSKHKVCTVCGLELAVEEIAKLPASSSSSGSSSSDNDDDDNDNNNSGNTEPKPADPKPEEPVKPEEPQPVRTVRIELENYSADTDGIGGTVTSEPCAEGGEQLCGIQNYGYTKYDDIDFGTKGFKYAVVRGATPMDGGTVEIRVDALEGDESKLIGTATVTKTGDWSAYQSFECTIDNTVTGTHDVYVVFRGNGYLFNLNWLELCSDNTNKVTSVKITDGDVTVGDVLTATVVPEEATVRYEWYVGGVLADKGTTYNVSPSNAGKTIQLKVIGLGSYSGTTESNTTGKVLKKQYILDFESIAYDAFTSFNNKYYSEKDGVGKIKSNYFWDYAEMYEIVLDAYEHSGEARYKNMIKAVYLDFTGRFGTEWEFNDFNDDIMWMVIACTRAYNLTGEQVYLDTAIKNFDIAYNRAASDDLGGGIFWKTDNQSKNACVNCPGAIAACLLGKSTGDNTYYEKAKGMFDWVVEKLFVAETGRVLDNMDINGEIYNWEFTYNQATFVGAATLLYEHYGDAKYLEYAGKSCDYTMNTMYQGGVVNNEAGSSNNYDDSQGFKGIMPRWFYLYAVNHNNPEVMEWMQMNAATAWENRNSEGIMWTRWGEKTADNTEYSSFGASTAVGLLQNVTNSTNMIKNGTEVQAEDFNSCRGIVMESSRKSIGSIQDGYYTVYQNIDFGSEAAIRAKFTAASALKGGSIEIRLGDSKGELLGTAEIKNTGSWSNWSEFVCEIEPTTGVQDICLVFKGEGFLFNLDKFGFTSEALELGGEETEEPVTDSKSAYSRIEMESYDEKADSVGTEGAEGGTVLAGIQNGAYAVYKNVEFGEEGTTKVAIRASAWNGGTIEIRDGAIDGTILATCEIASTGDWQNFKTFMADVTSAVTGKHDLYLVFVGTDAMYNLNWFEFYESTKTVVTSVTINESVTVGDEVKATVEPADATVNYEWYVDGVFKGYSSTYKTTAEDVGKSILLKVTGYGECVGSIESNTTNKVSSTSTPAYTTIQCEDFSEKGGNVGSSGTMLDGINQSGYALYKNIDFGANGPKKFIIKASSDTEGGKVELRADAMEGEKSILIGTCEITNTGGWSNWQEFDCDATGVTGVHDLYLVVSGPGYLFNLDWFKFSDEEEKEVTGVSLTTDELSVGDTLEAKVEPAGANVNYEWLVNGEVRGTGSSYTVKFSDAGYTIKVKVTGIGAYTGTKESNETGKVKSVEVNTVDAYGKIQAENNDEVVGASNEGCGDEGGGQHLAGINTYGYALYAGVDFGEDSPVSADFRASSDASGGNIKIYLDAKDDDGGKLIGTCEVTPTGGWGNWDDFSCELDAEGVTGTHNVYLVFEGDGYLYNFNWFRFNK